MQEIVFTFSSTHIVIAAESALLKEGIPVKVRPLPSAIRAGCGLTLCVSLENLSRARSILTARSLNFDEIYQIKDGDFTLYK